jgi:hypothetical protein
MVVVVVVVAVWQTDEKGWLRDKKRLAGNEARTGSCASTVLGRPTSRTVMLDSHAGEKTCRR